MKINKAKLMNQLMDEMKNSTKIESLFNVSRRIKSEKIKIKLIIEYVYWNYALAALVHIWMTVHFIHGYNLLEAVRKLECDIDNETISKQSHWSINEMRIASSTEMKLHTIWN